MMRRVKRWGYGQTGAGCWLLSAVLGVLLPWTAAARAESLLPLAAETAWTLPSGVAEASVGVAYANDGRFPFFTPAGTLRRQTLVEVPQVGFRIGAGAWAEFHATYETIYLDEQAANGQTNNQFGGGDARIFTKLRLHNETDRFPGLGMSFGTKLPNASRSSGLGTDDTDFAADALVSKDLGPVVTHLNLGIWLLGNSGPMIGHSFSAGGQDDVLHYDVAVTSHELGETASGAVKLRLLGEIDGLTNSHANYGNDRSAIRTGIQLTRGAGMAYLGVSAGLITGSENLGASMGFVYTFEPGRMFGEE